MRKSKIAVILTLFLVTSVSLRAQTARERYVGKSPCDVDIQSKRPDFSLRLDKVSRTDLVNRNMPQSTVLFIVQYKDESDNCGVIRDVIEIRHLSEIFHFNCVDPQAPRDVVVGTRGINDRNLTGLSIDSWQINTEKQTFNKLNHKVSCTYQGSSGSDDGSDLVDLAKSRGSHTRSD